MPSVRYSCSLLRKLQFIILSLFLCIQANAAPFQFSIGDLIHVASDKGYRYGGKNRFEVVGNVVIIHKDEALYGEAGSLDMDTGEVNVKGNVRYIAPEMTMYGSELGYNMKSGNLFVKNARILSRGYSVQGEYMVRVAPNTILAEDAEYTTCRDCPESWSVFGKKVKIILNQYIHVTHALIKVNGVSIMYLPYMVIPIKRQRQTGFLFPQFSLSFKEGLQYSQPWFWAISDNRDMTLIPWSKGKRGLGNELEYRHILGEKKWFEVHSLQSFDRIYLPEKRNDDISGHHYFRHASDYEHHYQIGNFFNHHLYFQNFRDLDVVSDFPSFVGPRLQGSEVGGESFFNLKSSLMDFNVESYFKKNLIVPDPLMFDHQYVQINPRVSLDFTPVNVVHTSWPILPNVALGGNGTYTFFKQNHFSEGKYIRNAHRFTANPFLEVFLGQLGPVDLKTNVQWDFQRYYFPYEKTDKIFNKKGTILVSQASFEIDKIFNLAYQDKIPVDRIELLGLEKKNKTDSEYKAEVEGEQLQVEELNSGEKEELIGEIPSYESSYVEDYMVLQQSSYRHSMVFNFRHHFTMDQTFSGNPTFERQIQLSDGLFDYQDTPRRLRHVIGSLNTKTDISQRNTLEFNLLNSLFKKDSKNISYNQDGLFLRDHFTYSKLAYLNISQGLELRTGERHFIDKLTRLALSSGFPIYNWNIGLSEYYFYKTKKHQFVGSLSRGAEYVDFSTTWKYDSLVEPANKTFGVGLTLRPVSTFQFTFRHEHNLTLKQPISTFYQMIYAPWNNCWKIDLGYLVNTEDKQIIFNFLLNFGENRFTSLLSPIGGGEG